LFDPFEDKDEMKIKILKQIQNAFAIAVFLGCYLTVLITFSTAYFTPEKAILIAIDSWGEAAAEFILLLAAAPFLGMFILKNLKTS